MSLLPAGLLLFDTGIYIRFSRGDKYHWLGEDARLFQRTILTAVVPAELYAGTHSQQESEPWINYARPTVLWATFLRPRAPPGLTPAFCSAVPEALSDKWILSAIFAIY
jgi:hypothetical protein